MISSVTPFIITYRHTHSALSSRSPWLLKISTAHHRGILDTLYGRMINQVRISEDARVCKRILAVMLIAYRPITLNELIALAEIPDDICDDNSALLEIIAICGSFLTWRKDVVFSVHQYAKEFLLERARIFPENQEARHLAISSRYLKIIFRTLQRNILDIKLCGSSTEEYTHPRSNPLAAIQYACRVDVVKTSITALIMEVVWIDFYGKNIFAGMEASGFWDAYQKGHTVESSLGQVYSSGLLFSLTQSTTRICYQKEQPDWILNSPVVDERWTSSLQILEGHNGSRFASASSDETVRIWDPATDQCVCTLNIHSVHLQFEKNKPTYLYTIIGTLYLGSTEPVAPGVSRLTLPAIHGFGLSDDFSWITFNGSNVLWLPPEYRPFDPSSFLISAATVAIGRPSGCVIFLALSEHNPLSRV
ncbi:Vegetative incompatibility protein HET-E-1 [Penicillium chrysogenum]|uniref:Vegetative incompatibility protein HET-E-1 n=1 Tax=Penicillium chrysogenum TaxID=5076 RepID=A0ABQ8WEX1_PENCH|nr:Vegetative incompatibility protein HET-E-1 [Penicillium chrysogenum]KAJ6148678.1 Vegetative incompatibility protein HET-E-1 [Penicillium chrysogenum]